MQPRDQKTRQPSVVGAGQPANPPLKPERRVGPAATSVLLRQLARQGKNRAARAVTLLAPPAMQGRVPRRQPALEAKWLQLAAAEQAAVPPTRILASARLACTAERAAPVKATCRSVTAAEPGTPVRAVKRRSTSVQARPACTGASAWMRWAATPACAPLNGRVRAARRAPVAR